MPSPMHSSRSLVCLCLCAVFLGGGGLVTLDDHHDDGVREWTFAEPVDALSVTFTSEHEIAEVSGFDGTWTEWKTLRVENEQDPTLRESNLVLFDRSISKVHIRKSDSDARVNDDATIMTLHPIQLSKEPVRYQVAATRAVDPPRILSRSEWGANERLLVDSRAAEKVDAIGDNGDNSQSSERVTECDDLQKQFPSEFKTSRTVRTNATGEALRWAQQYSPSVRLLVVHHTAIALTGDSRGGLERMRALYAYHAQNRGWGDIGYHFVIDEEGQIYEGRAGGDFVVGGHAYCNNTGTIGVALMGNFDKEKPTQKQMQSLQWMLRRLGDQYGIDLNRRVLYHGKDLSPIVGHRDLLSTDCPGELVWRTMSQVREHVRTGDTAALIVFPRLSTPAPSKPSTAVTDAPRVTALGDTLIEGRPGGEIIVPLQVRAGTKALARGAKAAVLRRSQPRLGVAVERGDAYTAVRRDLVLPLALNPGDSVVMRLKIQLPMERGTYILHVGDLTYTFTSEGKRVREPQILNTRAASTPVTPRTERPARVPSAPASSSFPARPIRIKLHDASLSANTATIQVSAALIKDTQARGVIRLRKIAENCSATWTGGSTSASALRIDPGSAVVTLSSWKKAQNRYRGTLECRVVDGQLTLINELPLETYLHGLAEEPDSEPYEKQRAFAIAARTYAAYYTDPASSHRKFPGKPYDGSDSAAEFQLYGGVAFEESNPRWLDAVRSTEGAVLTYQKQLIRPPYFSSDDGRTRSPMEAGWTDFPFAEIFASKPDPWCEGETMHGHGVGMSGCGAEGQANDGKSAEDILSYYYPGTTLQRLSR